MIPSVDDDYSAAFDGEHINLVWRQTMGQVRGFRMTRIAQSGEVLDPGGVALMDPTPWWSMWSPTLSVGRNRILFGHSRFVPDASYAADRIQWRWIGPPPATPTVDAAVDVGTPPAPDATQPPPIDSAPMPPADAGAVDVAQTDVGLPATSDAGIGVSDAGPDAVMSVDTNTQPDSDVRPDDALSSDSSTIDGVSSDGSKVDVSSPGDQPDVEGGDAIGGDGQPSTDASSDASSDASPDAGDGGGGLACSCDIGRQPLRSGTGGSAGVLLLVVGAFVQRRRRGRLGRSLRAE